MAGEGDFKDSATEIDSRAHARLRWKGEVRAHRHHGDMVALQTPFGATPWRNETVARRFHGGG
jgi:hypothetical protein